MILTAGLASNASAAINLGVELPDGSWTVAGRTIELQTTTSPFGFGAEDRVSFSSTVRVALGTGGPFSIAFRRDSDLGLTGSETEDFLPIYNSFVGGFGAGAQTGSDNFLLLSLEPGQSDWDTVVQFNFDDGIGISGDSIIGVWHDDSASGENILADISNFSELDALAIPEPASALYIGLAVLAFVANRKRK
ncbi:MAG: hypothetical protein AAF546_10725 [Verrucomicrobiota bacterium]